MSPADLERRAEAAEKTAAVLKRKVREMYGGGGQTALYRALEKAKRRDERSRQRREVAEVRAAELRKYTEHLEEEVARRTRAIQSILDNVTFGFLVIDRDLAIREGFTRSCAALFGRAPVVGESLGGLLGLAESEHSELSLSVDQVFEDLLPEEATLDQIAERFAVGGRVLHVDARTIRDHAGAVEALLLTVSDISALEAARKESRLREVLIGILQQRSAFEQFVADTRAMLRAARSQLDDGTLLRRVVHTVKGNAASWGLDEVVEVAHTIETRELLDAPALDRLAGAVRGFLEAHQKILELDYERAESAYAVTGSDLQRLREVAASSDSEAVRRWVSGVVQRPARELLGPVATFVTKLAERLGKEVDFELVGGDLLVDADVMRPVLRNLPHLIRNAIDHGIEPAWERGDKKPRGLLSVTLSEASASWEVAVVDDGRGVPVEAIGRRAVAMGLVKDEQLSAMSPSERVQLIFVDGVSSADRTTDISGRGVGMSAVQAAVRARGGTVELTSDERGTRVLLRVPRAGAG